jgi:SAM-dependent methyltransferase
MMQYNFVRYLEAKTTVDDRALNRVVWDTMAESLRAQTAGSEARVFEAGAGSGTMLARLHRWGLHPQIRYTGLDENADNVAHARTQYPNATFIQTDLFDIGDRVPANGFELVIANALLDLLSLKTALPLLLSRLRPGGVFYFTINFDGETIFEPLLDPALDQAVLDAYHHTMDTRQRDGKPTGDSKTGRKLIPALQGLGVEIRAAGSSDWVVYAGRDGYPADEAYFLHHILHFFATSLNNHPDIPAKSLRKWLETRHKQVESGELVYIAHQLDVTGVVR